VGVEDHARQAAKRRTTPDFTVTKSVNRKSGAKLPIKVEASFVSHCGSMTKLIVWTRLTVHAFSAADKVGGRAPQGAKTGAAFVVDIALAIR